MDLMYTDDFVAMDVDDARLTLEHLVRWT